VERSHVAKLTLLEPLTKGFRKSRIRILGILE
jgi:hypothetical protein